MYDFLLVTNSNYTNPHLTFDIVIGSPEQGIKQAIFTRATLC